MIQKYLRAASVSFLLSTGCDLWDFSDCRVTEMDECILYGRPDRLQERLEAKGHLIYQMKNHLWSSKVAESFGCGDGNSRQAAINESWRDAHLTFEREFGSAVRHRETTLLESTLNLSEEKKYVACARVIPAYELSRER